VEKKHRTQVVLSEVEENEAMSSSIQVSSIESRAIDCALETSEDEEGPVKPRYDTVPCAADEISSVLVPVSPIHGYFLCHKESWKIVPRTQLLSAIRD
jgi:hypothetical protein